MAAPIVDDIAEATEAAQAQAIPESLAEYGIEPVTDEVDAAQVEATAFPPRSPRRRAPRRQRIRARR